MPDLEISRIPSFSPIVPPFIDLRKKEEVASDPVVNVSAASNPSPRIHHEERYLFDNFVKVTKTAMTLSERSAISHAEEGNDLLKEKQAKMQAFFAKLQELAQKKKESAYIDTAQMVLFVVSSVALIASVAVLAASFVAAVALPPVVPIAIGVVSSVTSLSSAIVQTAKLFTDLSVKEMTKEVFSHEIDQKMIEHNVSRAQECAKEAFSTLGNYVSDLIGTLEAQRRASPFAG